MGMTLGLVLLLSSAQAQGSLQALLQQASHLEQTGEEAQALSVYRQVLVKDPQNETALVRASVLTTREADAASGQRSQSSSYKQAIQWAEAAVHKSPDGYEANLALAVALNGLGSISGAKEKMDDWKLAEAYLDKAIQINPKRGEAYYARGKWYTEVIQLNFAEREAARLLFGGLPKVTVAMAKQDFQTCVTLSPRFLPAYLELAEVCHEEGNDGQAIKLLQTAIRLHPSSAMDRSIQEECQAMLQRLQ